MKKILAMILIAAMVFSVVSATAAENDLQDLLSSHKTVGDVNTDGVIDANDALYLLLFAARKSPPLSSTYAYLVYEATRIVLDVNEDDMANAADALMILQHAVGKRQDFPRKDLQELQEFVDTVNQPA